MTTITLKLQETMGLVQSDDPIDLVHNARVCKWAECICRIDPKIVHTPALFGFMQVGIARERGTGQDYLITWGRWFRKAYLYDMAQFYPQPEFIWIGCFGSEDIYEVILGPIG